MVAAVIRKILVTIVIKIEGTEDVNISYERVKHYLDKNGKIEPKRTIGL
jgi:hypothetical protein